MQTTIWRHTLEEAEAAVQQHAIEACMVRWNDDLREAAQLLRAGELVAFPTETVYGLGADALNPAAVLKIFAIKGRPADNPLIVHVDQIGKAHALSSEWPPLAEKLAREYWPGPLTLVVPVAKNIPHEVTAGLSTVAIRIPYDETALKLCAYTDRPIAAPSANLSGRPSPTKPEHVIEDLNGKIAGIIAGFAAKIGLESTVVDVTGATPIILRPGYITRERIEKYLQSEIKVSGELESDPSPRSPGIKYTHYAPQAEMFLLGGSWENQLIHLRAALARHNLPEPLAIICSHDTILALQAVLHIHSATIYNLGARNEPENQAKKLYATLRECDASDTKLILAETYPETDYGAALMNRLRKAAGGKIWNP